MFFNLHYLSLLWAGAALLFFTSAQDLGLDLSFCLWEGDGCTTCEVTATGQALVVCPNICGPGRDLTYVRTAVAIVFVGESCSVTGCVEDADFPDDKYNCYSLKQETATLDRSEGQWKCSDVCPQDDVPAENVATLASAEPSAMPSEIPKAVLPGANSPPVETFAPAESPGMDLVTAAPAPLPVDVTTTNSPEGTAVTEAPSASVDVGTRSGGDRPNGIAYVSCIAGVFYMAILLLL